MRIAFRTDASIDIGTGHVMRCLTLANALREQGVESSFVCRAHEGHLADKIKAAGHTVNLLPPVGEVRRPDANADLYAHWLGCDWQKDADQTVETLANDYDWLVVDHYGLDARWETALRSHTKRVMAIDDMGNRPHDCDMLLDQNLIAHAALRYDGLIPENCTRLLGPNYALLQRQYAELRPKTTPRQPPVKRVLVYFGGSDSYDLAGKTIEAFIALNRNDIILDVVASQNSLYAQRIDNLARGHANINWHEPMPSLATLMSKADLAIGAGGATSWERCCLGLPTLVITLADNQKPIAEALSANGYAQWLGHYDDVNTSMLKTGLSTCLDGYGLTDWSHRCYEVTDGAGASRVVQNLLNLQLEN